MLSNIKKIKNNNNRKIPIVLTSVDRAEKSEKSIIFFILNFFKILAAKKIAITTKDIKIISLLLKKDSAKILGEVT